MNLAGFQKYMTSARVNIFLSLLLFVVAIVSYAQLIPDFPINRNEPTALLSAFGNLSHFTLNHAARLPIDHLPGYFLLLKGYIWLFGASCLSVKFLSAILVSLTAVCVFIWSNKVQGKVCLSFVLSLLFIFSHKVIIDAGASVQPYALFLLLTFLSFILFEKVRSRNAKAKEFLLYFIVHVLGCLSFYFYYIIAFSQLVYLFIFYRKALASHRVLSLVGFCSVIGLFAHKTPEILSYRMYGRMPLTYPVEQTVAELKRTLFGEDILFHSVPFTDYVVLGIFAVGVFGSFSKFKKQEFYYSSLFLLSLAFIFIFRHVLGKDEIVFRYVIYIVPIFWYFVLKPISRTSNFLKYPIYITLVLCFLHGWHLTFIKGNYGSRVFQDQSQFIHSVHSRLSANDSVVYLLDLEVDYYFAATYRATTGERMKWRDFRGIKPVSGQTYYLATVFSEKPTLALKNELEKRRVDYEILWQESLGLKGWFPEGFVFAEVLVK